MGGLGNLFKKIIPIIMLVCFICLGITHTFQQVGQNNITYLTQQVYTENGEWKPIENATQEEIENGHNAYKLDINSYMQNINVNILKDATNNAIDTQTYLNTLDIFNAIWEDGYQLFDISYTILNSVILVINTLITIINFAIVPIRIIAGILLTGMSLIGINIATNGIITNGLRALLTILAIPLIPPAYNENGNIEDLTNTNWEFIDAPNYATDNRTDYNFNFTSNGNSYKGIHIEGAKMFYKTNSGTTKVYEVGIGWTNQAYRQIHITNANQFAEGATEALNFLKAWCFDKSINNTDWYFNEHPTATSNYQFYINFTCNNESYKEIIFYGNQKIEYIKNDNSVVEVYSTYSNISQWNNENYRTIHITSVYYNVTEYIVNMLLKSNATQI